MMALVLVAHARAVGTGAVRGSCRLVPPVHTHQLAKIRMTHGVIDVAWCRSVMAMGSSRSLSRASAVEEHAKRDLTFVAGPPAGKVPRASDTRNPPG